MLMSHVKVKQKHQVTIPSNIRKLVDINEGDILEISVKDGNIVLIPLSISQRGAATKPSLLSLAGKNKGSGLYRDADEINSFIQGLREEWN